MDNLRACIEALFYKRDPEEFLLTADLKSAGIRLYALDKESFVRTFMSRDLTLTTDLVEAIYDHMMQEWMPSSNPLDLITFFARQVLTLDGLDPECLFEHYLRWSDLSEKLGEDIFTTAFIADKRIYKINSIKNLGWKPVLTSDSAILKGLFRNTPAADLHFHLKGSTLVFDVNWLAIMNYPDVSLHKLAKEETRVVRFARLAALLRLYLFYTVKGLSPSTDFQSVRESILGGAFSLQSIDAVHLNQYTSSLRDLYGRKISSYGCLDYAIPSVVSELDQKREENIILVGERDLLYSCFSLLSESRASQYFSTIFYTYLLLKIHVGKYLLQSREVGGFSNFQKFDSRKSFFLELCKRREYEAVVPYLAIRGSLKNSHIRYLESRIAPKDNVGRFNKMMEESIKTAGDDRNGYIVHFIKKKSRKDEVVRHQELRSNLEKQANALNRVLEGQNGKYIVGIDAASSEFACRAEVFAPIYRKLRQPRERRLGFTFHAGEGFYDIVDGLRAIDEAIRFLGLKDGDRLGHAVALGLDVKPYYKRARHRIVMPAQCLMDNLAWILYRMDKHGIDSSAVHNRLEDSLSSVFYDIYDETIDYHDYVRSWMLRGDAPELYCMDKGRVVIDKSEVIILPWKQNDDSEALIARKHQSSLELYYNYHHLYSERSDAINKMLELKYDDELVGVIEQIQRKMQFEVAAKGICIEANPSSNLRICQVPAFAAHPFVSMNDFGLPDTKRDSSCPNIPVTINTDDQGTFTTSLEKEYTLLAIAMRKIKDESDKPKYSMLEIANWLRNIREESIRQTFHRFNNFSSRDALRGGAKV